MPKGFSPMASFLMKVEGGPGCWNWKGGLGSSSKRPMFRSSYSHRWLYERVVASIPEGMELDHTCKNPMCVRPDHMEPVTHEVNMKRVRVSRCRSGRHDLTDPSNQRFDEKGYRRGCRLCLNENRVRRYHRLKGADSHL